MSFRSASLLLLFTSNFITIFCQDQLPKSKEIPLWEKVSAILGIVFIIISAVLYATRNRNINVRVLLRDYISPSQAEVTFVNFKHDHERGVEAVIQTSPPSRAQQLDEDNNCLSKQEQLSVDNSTESQVRNLSSVFENKQGGKGKKSKTRKRLANNAKLTNNNEEETIKMEDEGDL